MSTRGRLTLLDRADSAVCGIDRIVTAMGIGLLLVTLAAINIQVLMRYVFNNATSWAEELSTTAFAWGTILGSAAATGRGANLTLSLLTKRTHGMIRQLVLWSVELMMLGFGILLTYSGVLLMQMTRSANLGGLRISQAVVYACLPIAGAVISLVALTKMAHLAVEDAEAEAPSGNGEAEAPSGNGEVVER